MEEPDSDPLLFCLNLLPCIFTGDFSVGIAVSLSIILILFFFSAMISGSEIAFFSLNPSQIRQLQSENNKINKQILVLLEKPKRLLATILIANNFVNVAIIILSTFVTNYLFDFGEFLIVGFLIEVIVIATMILLFGEIMPKIYANQKPLTFALFMVQPLNIMIKLFYPLNSLMVRSTHFIDKKVAVKNAEISMSELSDAIDITADNNSFQEETKILKGIVKFTDIEVKEIMKSRMDVVAINADTSFPDLITIIKDSGYSRIPVYEETLDHVKGILYVKDLIPHVNSRGDFKWIELLRSAFFVPENKKINDLLQEFQEKKIHLAVVVDEYGGTSGIITFEDIIEEIVGEISDEFDTPEDEIEYKKLDSNNYIFEGKISINDFCKIIGFEDDVFDEIKGDADSLAGVILELLGEIPVKNTVVRYRNFELIILTVDKRRIKQIKVTINDAVDRKENPE